MRNFLLNILACGLLGMLSQSCVGAGKFKRLEESKTALEKSLNATIQNLNRELDQSILNEQQLRDEQIKQNTLLTSLLADKLNQEKEIRSLQAKIKRMTDASESEQAVLNEELQAKNESLQQKEALLNELVERYNQQQSILKDISSDLSQSFETYDEEQLEWYLVDQKLEIVVYNSTLFDSGGRLTVVAQRIFDKLSVPIRSQPSLMVTIEGHTDNDLKMEATALETSVLNAAKIARYFLDEGRVNSNQIQVAGRGGFAPRVSNQTPAGRQLNNRVEVQLQFSNKGIFELIRDQK